MKSSAAFVVSSLLCARLVVAQTGDAKTVPPEAGERTVHAEAPNGAGLTGCPFACTKVLHQPGDTWYACEWDLVGAKNGTIVGYVPGTRDDKTCLTAGAPLDVEPRHRLFVHGLHADFSTWGQWYWRVKTQMDYLGFKTVADATGKTDRYGDGSADLLQQVWELAAQINQGLSGVGVGTVEVYAHSLGALKIEALLQLGYLAGQSCLCRGGTACPFSSSCGDPLFQAASKLGRIYVFQGAHGGCGATAANGDSPNHFKLGFPPYGCPASKSIGFVNDQHTHAAQNVIPGTDQLWDMTRIVWKDRPRAEQKHIHYAVAVSNGGQVCQGAAGFICGDGQPHDGVVYAWQMVPTWYFGYATAESAGLVTSALEPGHYCHLAEDVYEPPRESNALMMKYVGIKQGFSYFVPGKRVKYTTDRQITSCDTACFCGRDPYGACANHLDCRQWGGFNCIPEPGGGGGRPPSNGIVNWAIGFEPPFPASDLVTWTRCAAEGETCTFQGPRLVRFGANASYSVRRVTDGTACTAAIFGDPMPTIPKACDIETQVTSDQ